MRLFTKAIITTGLALMLSSQANAYAIDLLPDNASPGPSDTVTVDIQVTVGGGEGLTAASAAIDFMGASFVSGTEAAFNLVGGVPVLPIGVPGSDIQLINTTRVIGWEGTTLNPAAGPAVFSLGTATFHVNALPVSLTLDDSIGLPGGTNIGDENFESVAGSASYGNFTYPVPEPTTAGLMTLGLVGLAAAGRRRC